MPQKLLKSATGQVTIFFATAVVIMITLMAFIINIGIFVKAKINLQNATDAAAFGGASVQARQLTNIAYLNWEMRNIYKEWMFKYYVLGGLNLEGVAGGGSVANSTNFAMSSYTTALGNATDTYNFPSICIDFANTGDVGLCTKFVIPGLPRFSSSNVLGMDETTNAFVDAVVAQKNKDCALRSKLNYATAVTWAYNISDNVDPNLVNLRDQVPEIAAGRQGAFPQAFEVALRIRNLEAQVNAPAVSNVCIQVGAHPNCSTGIEDITGTNQTPSLERIYKAFYSGFRNLGSENDREMRASFTLSEIPPKDVTFGDAFSLSTLLIPNGAAQTKRFLDLKLMTLNYATFYTAFTSNKSALQTSIGDVAAEGGCTATKTGLPVPGYPLGYVKNPDVITYYAVKGEAQFIGLFNPFRDLPMNLTAYAAAKPFGGRIGPMIFNVTQDETAITPRREFKKSSPYMVALQTSQFRDRYNQNVVTGYEPGVPLPLNFNGTQFWLTDAASNIGGYAGSSQAIFFGIPNIAYDYPGSSATTNPFNHSSYKSQADDILVLNSAIANPQAGLYNNDMFEKLKSRLRGVGGSVDTQAIEDGTIISRAPTLLDVNNYLIPTPEKLNDEVKTDSFGVIYSEPIRLIEDANGESFELYNHAIYAPLYSTTSDSIFQSAADIELVLDTYLNAQKLAIDKYVESMSVAAQAIYTTNFSANTGQNLAIEAANTISDIDSTILADANADVTGQKPQTCNSIAGQFSYYYLGAQSGIGDTTGCPAPLKELMMSRWNSFGFSEDYLMEYVVPVNMKQVLFSAYRPGAETDASNGVQRNVLSGRSDTMIRNFYSTKFVSLKSITTGSAGTYTNGLSIFNEGSTSQASAGSETGQRSFANELDTSNLDLQRIRH